MSGDGHSVEKARRLRRRLHCLMRGHAWSGYEYQPLALIGCKRCGLVP